MNSSQDDFAVVAVGAVAAVPTVAARAAGFHGFDGHIGPVAGSALRRRFRRTTVPTPATGATEVPGVTSPTVAAISARSTGRLGDDDQGAVGRIGHGKKIGLRIRADGTRDTDAATATVLAIGAISATTTAPADSHLLQREDSRGGSADVVGAVVHGDRDSGKARSTQTTRAARTTCLDRFHGNVGAIGRRPLRGRHSRTATTTAGTGAVIRTEPSITALATCTTRSLTDDDQSTTARVGGGEMRFRVATAARRTAGATGTAIASTRTTTSAVAIAIRDSGTPTRTTRLHRLDGHD
jgi:hypothetical protein